MPEPQAAPETADDVRRLTHALDAPGQHELGFTELNEPRAARSRLDARAAQTVQSQGRDVDGHTSLECDVARAVDGVRARLHDIAKDGVVDPFRLHAGSLE